MIIEIDIGNTRTKWRLRNGEELSSIEALPSKQFFSEGLPLDYVPAAVHVASVASAERHDAVLAMCRSRWGFEPRFAEVRPSCAGLTHAYTDGSSLGVDRWLAMLAAFNAARKPRPLCVVSSGTALTVDLIAPNGKHCGGYIIPGVDVQRSALLSATQRIICEADQSIGELLPANNTQDAVNRGILMSHVGLLLTAGRRFAETHGPLTASVTGGNRRELVAALLANSESCWAGVEEAPGLVLDGLQWAALD